MPSNNLTVEGQRKKLFDPRLNTMQKKCHELVELCQSEVVVFIKPYGEDTYAFYRSRPDFVPLDHISNEHCKTPNDYITKAQLLKQSIKQTIPLPSSHRKAIKPTKSSKRKLREESVESSSSEESFKSMPSQSEEANSLGSNDDGNPSKTSRTSNKKKCVRISGDSMKKSQTLRLNIPSSPTAPSTVLETPQSGHISSSIMSPLSPLMTFRRGQRRQLSPGVLSPIGSIYEMRSPSLHSRLFLYDLTPSPSTLVQSPILGRPSISPMTTHDEGVIEIPRQWGRMY